MSRYALISRLILTIFVLGLLFASQPIEAASPLMSKTIENQKTSQKDDAEDSPGGQVAVQLSQDEIDSIAAALPEGEVRQKFKNKFAAGAEKDNGLYDESYRSGVDAITLFYKAEQVVSRALEQIHSFFTESTFDSREWTAALANLNQGKGFGHLMLTLFVVAVLIFCGLAMEWVVRRATENLRRQLLDTVLFGRLQFLGRVVSRLLLDLLSLGIFMLTSFVLFAFFYDEGDPGFLIVSSTLLFSYYLRSLILAANFILSPAAPTLRLLPLQDTDAKFLYRWFIGIGATAMGIGTLSYIFQGAGISQELFLVMYSMSGLSVTLLLVVMIWRSRRRVAQAIWSGDPAGDEAKTSLRVRIAKNWHFFAVLYVIGMGVFWFIRGLAEGEGAIVSLLISLFVIPVFIGFDQWAEHLLNIASGTSPSRFVPQATGSPETVGDTEATQSDKPDDQKADKKPYVEQHLPLMKRVLRVLLVALMFFVIFRLWGIDLPVGRLFTSTALKIVVVLLLGFAIWQYTKARIDRRLREEMPDGDAELEEGGSGGSRVGTLLVLLRKFILSVLLLLISLIILSSIGVEIGPLIAGAGVIGLAIGFGAQTLVRDILSGVFYLIDDAFRVGDYIESAGTKGTVEKISLRSLKLRQPKGMVDTIPFGDMGTVTNFSRDYIISKLEFRVRYDTDIDKVRKIVKNINKELQKDEEIARVLLDPIKSQGVRQLEDSAMIMRVKFKTIPGEQFGVRREVFKRIQEAFRENGIQFAHRDVTVYLPPQTDQATSDGGQEKEKSQPGINEKKAIEAGAAAAIAADQADQDAKK